MPSMFDLTCPKCRRRYGFAWERLAEAPPCPRCGAAPDRAALAKAKKEIIEEMRRRKSHG